MRDTDSHSSFAGPLHRSQPTSPKVRAVKSDFARFIDIASGSANEALYHMMLSRDLLLLSESTYESLAIRAVEVRRMLTSLAQTLRSRSSEQELKTED
jgi:hypothetical protein